MAVVTLLPFLLLHYPTHLAVGMVPVALILGHMVAAGPPAQARAMPRAVRFAVALALVAVTATASWWQLRRVAIDVWTAELERALELAASASDPVRRTQLASAVEWQILERIDRLPSAAPLLWRTLGKARIARGDDRGAEEAFRRSGELWPHEEAELGLGIALAEQGRRSEALIHLGRVCRTNPALTAEIADSDLRRSLEELNRTRSRR